MTLNFFTIKYYSGRSRLRSSHLDEYCFVSKVVPRGNFTSTNRRGFYHSYFYRSHLMWNLLPKTLRQTPKPSVFKKGFQIFLWNELSILPDSDFSENDNNDSQD